MEGSLFDQSTKEGLILWREPKWKVLCSMEFKKYSFFARAITHAEQETDSVFARAIMRNAQLIVSKLYTYRLKLQDLGVVRIVNCLPSSSRITLLKLYVLAPGSLSVSAKIPWQLRTAYHINSAVKCLFPKSYFFQ